MNKKVDKEYKDIKDAYILQCICSELKSKLQQKENIIKEVREINMYIYNNLANIDYGEVKCKINRVLEILDKENK